MHSRFQPWILCALVACGSEQTAPQTQGPSPTPDAGPVGEPDAGLPPPLTPPRFDGPFTVVVPEGGVASADLSASEPEGIAFAITDEPSGFTAEIDGARLTVRAGYETSPGVLALRLSDEAGTTSTAAIAVQGAPARWVDRTVWSRATGPEAREHPSAWVNASRNRAVLLQGTGYMPQFEQMLDDAWAFDLDTKQWTALSVNGPVPGRGSRRVAKTRSPDERLLFGGYGPAGLSSDALLSVTVTDDAVTFETVAATGPAPTPRALHAFAYDPESDTYVLFGGVGTNVFGDTWTMRYADGAAEWTPHTFDSAPSPRYGMFYGFDEATGRLIVFSGAQVAVAGNPINAAADAWALDVRAQPPVWTRLADGTEPNAAPGRRNGAGAWDPVAQRLFVFGGTADGRTTQPGVFALDARPDVSADRRWAALTPEPSPGRSVPPPRSSGVGLFANGRAYFGFGNDRMTFTDWGVLGI